MRLTTLQVLNAGSAPFPLEIRRQGCDEYFSVTQSTPFSMTQLYKECPVFLTIMTHIRGWAHRSTLPTAVMPPRGEQVTVGVNLLSVGQSDIALLFSGADTS